MGDRFDGALAGGGRAVVSHTQLADAMRTLTPGETLLVADEAGKNSLLHAVQNPYTGGLMCVSEQAPAGAEQDPRLRGAIARSQMTSMLTDARRVAVYDEALAAVLKRRPSATVLDVGAGTGLLSQLALRHGASHVHAVEMFEPLADLAQRLAVENGVADRMSVHAAKSTDLSIGPDDGMLPRRADVLVSEIFDSALLGEACLPVLRDARARLLNPGATVIPARAALYARVVTSELLRAFHDLGPDFPLHRDADGPACTGGVTPVPLHIDALAEERDYHYITDEFRVFDFDFEPDDESTDAAAMMRATTLRIPRSAPGRPDAVLAWWTLDLVRDGSVQYSTAPGAAPWQDHWQPVSHALPGPRGSADEGTIVVEAKHTELSVSFALAPAAPGEPCTCGMHALPGGPYRIAELGNGARLTALRLRVAAALADASENGRRARVLDVSDGAVCATLGLLCGIGADFVSVEEEDEVSTFVYGQVAARVQRETAALGSEVDHRFETLADLLSGETAAMAAAEASGQSAADEEYRGFDLMVSEPFVRAFAARPLEALANLLVQVRAASAVAAPTGLCVVPGGARIVARLVKFADDTLQRGRDGVGVVCGVSHAAYDALCAAAAREPWASIDERDSLPLFQYRLQASGPPVCVRDVEIVAWPRDPSALQAHVPEVCAETSVTVAMQACEPDALVLSVEYEGIPVSRVARSEVAWLVPDEVASASKTGGLNVVTRWDASYGTWEVRLAPAPAQKPADGKRQRLENGQGRTS